MEITRQVSNYIASANQQFAGKKIMFFTGEVICHCPQGQYFMAFLCMKGWCHIDTLQKRASLRDHHHLSNDSDTGLLEVPLWLRALC